MPKNTMRTAAASAHGGTAARRRGRPNVRSSAPAAGHTATHDMHAVHSADFTDARTSTGSPAGHAFAHFAQSMHASAFRTMRVGLTRPTSPISAPYGHR